MKKIVLFVALIVGLGTALAQDVDINKETNLVKVGGKAAFYLTPRNKQLLESDYSLENLEHKELAYLKRSKSGSDVYYSVVFTKSGNQCNITNFGTFGVLKHLAKTIAGAGVIHDNAISDEEERKFVTLHGGQYVGAQPAQPSTPEPKRPTAGMPADITIKGTSIYNNSEAVGVYKLLSQDGYSVITVYNANDAMICKAKHKNNDDNADWELTLDGKVVTVLYNPATPLEKLFKYLAEKGYL